MKPILGCTIFLLLFLARAVALEKCVTVRITNGHARTVTVAHGPVDLIAEVRVIPDERHRYLETVWDYAPPDMNPQIDSGFMADDAAGLGMDEPDTQDGAVGSSLRSLNGAEQSIRNDVKMAHLEGGTYEIISTVYTDEARKKVCGRATARVTVR